MGVKTDDERERQRERERLRDAIARMTSGHGDLDELQRICDALEERLDAEEAHGTPTAPAPATECVICTIRIPSFGRALIVPAHPDKPCCSADCLNALRERLALGRAKSGSNGNRETVWSGP